MKMFYIYWINGLNRKNNYPWYSLNLKEPWIRISTGIKKFIKWLKSLNKKFLLPSNPPNNTSQSLWNRKRSPSNTTAKTQHHLLTWLIMRVKDSLINWNSSALTGWMGSNLLTPNFKRISRQSTMTVSLIIIWT